MRPMTQFFAYLFLFIPKQPPNRATEKKALFSISLFPCFI